VLDAHPVLLDTLRALGFRPLAHPWLRRTVARWVTLRQACGHLGLDPEAVVGELNRAVASGTGCATTA
jgi:hypothetical protein